MSTVRFLSASPLWDDLAGQNAFRRPALLRFATDDFMDEIQKVLASKQPSALRKFVARYETWRQPSAGLPIPQGGPLLKLYQPVHGRFYMVTATLACRVPGLPEHTVDLADEETVSFVVRRVFEGREMAYVVREDGEGWAPVAAGALAEGEERHAMAGTFFTGDDHLTRRLFMGLIPVAKREAYVNGRELPETPAAPPPPGTITAEDPRVVEFQRTVLDPWVGLFDWFQTQTGFDPDTETDVDADLRRGDALTSASQASPLILMDFAEFLKVHLPEVWRAVSQQIPRTDLGIRQRALYDALQNVGIYDRNAQNRSTIRNEIWYADGYRGAFDALSLPASGGDPGLPAGFVARLMTGDPRDPNPTPAVPPSPAPNPAADHAALRALISRPTFSTNIFDRPIAALVRDALIEFGGPAETPGRLPSLPPLESATEPEVLFAIRCVYLRPRCGKKSPPLISDRSELFRMAGFYDPDAPARHLRVALPIDTSPAALRKYDRNVAFVLSNELRKQMSRVTSMKKLMDGKVGKVKGGLDVSVICSFSIPIITICALILLMLMVSLLNIVFWWIPFFITCFPVPRLKAK